MHVNCALFVLYYYYYFYSDDFETIHSFLGTVIKNKKFLKSTTDV